MKIMPNYTKIILTGIATATLFLSCKRNKFEFECMPPVTIQKGDLYVTNYYLLKENAGRPEYSPDGSLISYHAPGDDGYYDCYVMNADGTNPVCLTCDMDEFSSRHAGNSSWHPSGEYIVFQGEKEDYYRDQNPAMAHPGIGFNNDVYIMKSDGSQLWQITNLKTKQKFTDKTPFTGILHPHFNNAGNKISWAERIDKGGEWGEWELVIADFEIVNNKPVVSNIERFQPGEQHLYYETNDFSMDDSKLLICGNLKEGQREIGMDLYEFDMTTHDITPLTDSFEDWDESGHYRPDQKWIAYLGSEGYTPRKGKKWYKWGKAEFWLMKADGSRKYPITSYNCPDSADYTGKRIMPAYVVWSNDGNSILAGIVIEEGKNKLKDEIWVYELSEY
jgi:Tol biopolymer transport system component